MSPAATRHVYASLMEEGVRNAELFVTSRETTRTICTSLARAGPSGPMKVVEEAQ